MQRRKLPSGFMVVIMLEAQSVGSCTGITASFTLSRSSSCFTFGLIDFGTRLSGMTVGLAFSLISRYTSSQVCPNVPSRSRQKLSWRLLGYWDMEVLGCLAGYFRRQRSECCHVECLTEPFLERSVTLVDRHFHRFTSTFHCSKNLTWIFVLCDVHNILVLL